MAKAQRRKTSVKSNKIPHRASDAPQQKVTKLGTVIDLLRRPGGATIANLADATGWQHHTVRSVLSRTLPKGHGCRITSTKDKGGLRIYRIAGGR